MNPNWKINAATEYVVARLQQGFGINDSRGRQVGAEAIVYHERDGSFDVRIYTNRDGQKYGAIPRRNPAPTMEAAMSLAEVKLLKKGLETQRVAAKTQGIYLTDGERRGIHARAHQAEARVADHIDGYDRDDLGESFDNRHED